MIEMTRFTRRLRISKGLLWLALAMMAVAQCLPWERVRIHWKPGSKSDGAISHFSQVPCMWTAYRLKDSITGTEVQEAVEANLYYIHVIENPAWPDEVHAANGVILWKFTKGWLMRPFPMADGTKIALVVWPLSLLGMLAMPFLAGFLSRARPMLWMARLFACSMLVWVVRNFLLCDQISMSSPHRHHVASGYWLTLAALGVEIAALFLISNPVAESLRGASPPMRRS